jgi:hypothetical protein
MELIQLMGYGFLHQAADEGRYDLVREGVVIFLGALAKHLSLVWNSSYLQTELQLQLGCTVLFSFPWYHYLSEH